MSQIAVTRCDHCGEVAEHPSGWLHLTWDDTSLDGPTLFDFCSVSCCAAWAGRRELAVAQ